MVINFIIRYFPATGIHRGMTECFPHVDAEHRFAGPNQVLNFDAINRCHGLQAVDELVIVAFAIATHTTQQNHGSNT